MLTRLGNGLWRDAAAPAVGIGGGSRRRFEGVAAEEVRRA